MSCGGFEGRSLLIQNIIRRAFRLRLDRAMLRNGIVSGHRWGSFSPSLVSWRSRPRTKLQREIESAHDGDKKIAGTLEAILWQMVAHNSYHVGQIAMVRRALGAWPPRGGGDSW